MRGHRIIKHHYWWPRDRFPGKSKVIHMKRIIEIAYHNYFMEHCRKIDRRICWKEECRFSKYCCYHKRHDTF